MDPVNQYAGAHWRHRNDAAGHRRELHHLGDRRILLRLCRIQVSEGVVAAPQLRAFRRSGRRVGLHGCASLPLLGPGEYQP